MPHLKYLSSLIAIVIICISALYSQEFPTVNAKAAILIDADSSCVLLEHNSEKLLPPASLTKLMTEYIILEKIENTEIAWDDMVRIGPYPARISADSSLSDFNVMLGDEYSVKELFSAMAIFSANSASIALAEYISGTETEFVELMNQKALEMQMSSTKYYDSSGLSNGGIQLEIVYPFGGNISTASDTAKLVFNLLNKYPGVLDTTKEVSSDFLYNDGRQFKMLNWNRMLPGMRFAYEGLDGIKTGHTKAAGYCFAATAKRNNLRYISVVLGANSHSARFLETAKILDYGFSAFSKKYFVREGELLKMPVQDGRKDSIVLTCSNSIYEIVKITEEENSNIIIELEGHKEELFAPISKDDVVGRISIVMDPTLKMEHIYQNKRQFNSDLIATESVLKISLINKIIKNLYTLYLKQR